MSQAEGQTQAQAASPNGQSTTTSQTAAPASSAQGAQASGQPATNSPQNQAKPRPPKLAPAPVPQQTPWKAPVIDAATAKANFEAVDAAAQSHRRSKNPAVQRAREASREAAGSTSATAAAAAGAGTATAGLSSAPKRATTGKEKWVPFTPIIPPGVSSAGSNGSATARNRQNKRQPNAYRQRRPGTQNERGSNGAGSAAANGASDKRKPQQGQTANTMRNNGAGHQRAQSRSGTGKLERAGSEHPNGTALDSQEPSVEKLSIDDDSEAAAATTAAGSDGSDSTTSTTTSTTTLGHLSSASSSPPASYTSNANTHPRMMTDRRAHQKPGYIPRSQGGPRKPRDPRFGGPHKLPYYGGGGFIPGPAHGAPLGYLPMQSIPMANPLPTMASVPPPQDVLMAYLIPQVDYYFSVENLCKDTFLRRNMNNEGLVPVSVIANFSRVKSLTPEVSLVAEACTQAANIEVIGSKVRAAINHHLWVFPESQRLPAGLENGLESAESAALGGAAPDGSAEPKFQVDQAVPFVPKSAADKQ